MVSVIPESRPDLAPVIVELQQESRRKKIVFGLVLCIAIASTGTGNDVARTTMLILMFAIAVDLLSIRRCLHICRVLDGSGGKA